MYYPLKNQQQPISYFFLTHNCQEKNIAGILKSINHILRSIELDKFLWLGLNYNKVLKNNSQHKHTFLAAESGSVEVLVSFSDVVWLSCDGALPEFACDTEVPVVRSNTCRARNCDSLVANATKN